MISPPFRSSRAIVTYSLPAIALGLISVALYLLTPEIVDVLTRPLVDRLESLAFRGHRYALEDLRWFLRILGFLYPATALLAFGLGLHLPQFGSMGPIRAMCNHPLRTTWVLGILAALAATWVASLVTGFHPITYGDEYNYLFQAKLLSTGEFHADPPPVRDAFWNRAFVIDDRWYGIGFGGYAMALMIGLLLGSPYLIPLALACLNVVLIFFVSQSVYGPRIGLLAAGLIAVSPIFILYHATLLPEPLSLALVLGFLFGAFRLNDSGRHRHLILASACLMLLIPTRPQIALAALLPVAGWWLLESGRSLRSRIHRLAWLSIAGVLGTLALFAYAHWVNGEPMFRTVSPGYHRDELGGLSSLGIGSLQELTVAIRNLGVALGKLNFVLLGWPFSFAPLLLWLFRTEKRSADYVVASIACLIIGFYFLFPAHQEQYYVEAAALLTLLSAHGIGATLREPRSFPGQVDWRRWVTALIIVSYLLGALSIWPHRINYFRSRSEHERAVLEPIQSKRLGRAIVFLRNAPSRFTGSVGRNSPGLDDDVLFANVRDEKEIPEILAHFPDRTPYVLVYDTDRGGFDLIPYSNR